MKKNLIISIVITLLTPLLYADDPIDLTESMKESLVYLEVSGVSWEQIQPWKQTSVSTVGTYACAVGPYEVLAAARPFANAVSVQARRYGQNEYIPASIKVIDYDYNLCLIELDKTAVDSLLKPIQFVDKYITRKDLSAYWLSSGGHLTNARATLDRVEIRYSNISFAKGLQYILTNPSRSTGSGEVYFLEHHPFGLGCWLRVREAGLIPPQSKTLLRAAPTQLPSRGFGVAGFETTHLLDPSVRKFLKMPDDIRHGVYVSSVFKMGTGSKELMSGDVILSIAKQTLNPYGRYLDPRYDRLGFEHLISKEEVGDTMEFVIWRNGKEESVEVLVRDIKAKDMLVPYYEYDRRPEYIVLAGFIFQKLTRDYLTIWGDGWQGKTPPHLYQYFRDHAFNPTEERSDIVILSYVLPTEANIGFQQLGRLVVKSFNKKKISSFQDILEAMTLSDGSPFHVIEFELDSPAIVIAKDKISQTDYQIRQLYGIPQLAYIDIE